MRDYNLLMLKKFEINFFPHTKNMKMETVKMDNLKELKNEEISYFNKRWKS